MIKKESRRVQEWLQDIVSYGERLAGHLRNVDAAEFLARPVLQDAVIRCIEVIGEASHNILQIDPDAAKQFPDMQDAYWTRNRLAHGYYDLDLERVWLTATESVPAFVASVAIAVGKAE